MTERETRIRELVARLTERGSGVSPEYSLLSLDDTRFLLMEIDRARGQFNVNLGDGVEAVFNGYAYVVRKIEGERT